MSQARFLMEKLKAYSMEDARLVNELPESQKYFGNTQLSFQLGEIELQFTLDRGQWFLDLGRVDLPSEKYLWNDVMILLGLSSVSDEVDYEEAVTLDDIVRSLGENRRELEELFSSNRYPLTSERLKEIQEVRGREFLSRLGQVDR